MCEHCAKLDETIARYLRLQQQINDPQVQEAATRLVAELEAKKAELHLE
jgi:cell division protein FtsB